MFAAGRVRPKEKPGEGAIYRASLAMGVTVAMDDGGLPRPRRVEQLRWVEEPNSSGKGRTQGQERRPIF